MKKGKFLNRLLSAVCCVAMLVTMLPILPVAAADPAGVLFEDNFNSYTNNADLPLGGAADNFKLGSVQVRKDAATPGSYSITTTNGAMKISATDVVDSGDVSEVYAGVATSKTFGGSYTLTFDWMQETEDVYCTILYVAGTEVRVRMQNPTSTSALYNTIFFVNDGNQYLKNPDSGAQFKFGAAFGTWYTFEYFVDADGSSVTLNVYDKASGEMVATHTLKKAPVDDKVFEIRQFSVQGSDESGKTSTCYVDNLKVVSGIVETDREQGAVTGTTIGGATLSKFSDASEITYTKAAEVTAGLGLFAGADGKFMPKGTVTRAQMATIIVKMLNGSDANADSFKGSGKFSDVAGFEGGWAEGYVNWCSTLGIVSGYGDGTFRPGNQVTAAEAATMILNALKVDAGLGTWPHTVMAKAEELDMFDDLLTKPANDKALSREELAVMALVGLEYSPEGKQGYEYNGVIYDSYMDAYMVAGDASKINPTQGDSLAGKVFEMSTYEGYIVANEATNPDLVGVTTVYDPTKPADANTEDFFIATGLEHIGHYVTVYYKEAYTSDEEPGLTYTIYDETKVVVVDEEIKDSTKEYKALFGKSYKLASDVAYFNGQYVLVEDTLSGYTPGSSAPAGTYFIYEGAVVAYMESVTVYATKVLAVETVSGYETIELNLHDMPPISNSEDDDRIVEYKGIAEDDYVTYTLVGSDADPIYVLAETKPVTGPVTKTTTNEDSELVVVVKGKQYVAFGTDNNTTGLTNDTTFDFNATYTFYTTADGKYVGYEKDTGAADLTNTAFILGEKKIVEKDSYGKQVQKTYARGVDMDGNEVMLLVMVEKDGYNDSVIGFVNDDANDVCDPEYSGITANTFYTYKFSSDSDAKKENLYALKAYSGTSDYDEKTNPVVSFSYQMGSKTATTTVSAYNFQRSGNLFLRNTSAPYVMLDGTIDQATALTATVKKGTWPTFLLEAGQFLNRYMLVSKSDTGAYIVDAMVMVVDETVAADKQTVYIAAESLNTVSRDTDGYVYNVYDYKTGAAKQLTFETALDPNMDFGFWNVANDAETSCVTLLSRVKDVADAKSGLNYSTRMEKVEEDGLYSENIFYDQVPQMLENNEFYTTKLANRGSKLITHSHMYRAEKADAAVVIDTRSKDAIDEMGLGELNSVDRLMSLTERNENLVIILDACYSSGSSKLLAVFVKDAYYVDTNGVSVTERSGTFYINGKPVAADAVITDYTGRVQGDTTAEKMADLLTKYEADGTLNMTYTVTNGKVSDIKVTLYLDGGQLFYDDFEGYTADAELPMSGEYDNFALGSTQIRSTADTPGSYSFTTVGDSSNKQLEMSVKDVVHSADIGEVYAGVKSARKLSGSYTLTFDWMQETEDVYCTIVFVAGTELRVRMQKPGDTSAIYNTVFFNSNGNQYLADPDTGAQFKFGEAFGDWFTLEYIVDADNDTVTVNLYQKGSTDVLATKKLNVSPTDAVLEIRQYGVQDSTESGKISTCYIDNVKAEIYVAPEVEVDTYTVTKQVNDGKLGSVEVSAQQAEEGDEITVNTAVRSGYKLAQLLVNGDDVLDEVVIDSYYEYKFTMPAKAVTVKAVFEPIVKSSVTCVDVTTPGKAAVTVTGADDRSGVAEQTVLTVAVDIEDKDGYVVDEILVTDANGAPVAVTEDNTFVMPACGVEVTATLRTITYYAMTGTVLDDGGTVAFDFEAQRNGEARENSTVTVLPTAASGYRLEYVLLDGEVLEPVDGAYTFTAEQASEVEVMFRPEDEVFYDDFRTYSVGKFTTSSGDKWTSFTGSAGKYSHNIVSGDELELSATGSADNCSARIRASQTFSGSYTVEVGFRANPICRVVIIDLEGVMLSTSNSSTKTKFDLRLNNNASTGAAIYGKKSNDALTDPDNRFTAGAVDDDKNYYYLRSDGTANGSKVNAMTTDSYVAKIHVNDDAMTVTAELYKGGTLLGWRTLPIVTNGEAALDIEAHGPSKNTTTDTHKAYIDYVKVTSND